MGEARRAGTLAAMAATDSALGAIADQVAGGAGITAPSASTPRRRQSGRRRVLGEAEARSIAERSAQRAAGDVAVSGQANNQARALASGRASRDGWSDIGGSLGGSLAIVVPPSDAENAWRIQELDSRALDKVNPARLLELLADVSPDLSRGLWDFLRLGNPGYEIEALTPGSEDDAPHVEGQAELDAILARWRDRYGSADIPINRLFTSAFLRGALCAELVIDADGETCIDLATPDPASILFKRQADPILGTIWVPGQYQRGKFVPLTRPTFKYVPVDPMPGSPYGRSIAGPALFPTLFLLGLLHDLRRVIAQQGYPRIDVSIDMEALLAAMPDTLKADPVKYKAWVDAAIDEVEDALAQLDPDDTYVHTSVVVMNKPVGAVDSSSLSAVDGIIKGLERMVARALKTMPLLMGSTEGASEANANRQWEVHAAGIKSIQHLAENLLGGLLTLALQAKGIIATVEVRFAELRAAERMRDAQAERLEIANERAKYAAGWIDQDEASQTVTGHPAVEKEPRPLQLAAGSAGPTDSQAGTDQNPDPGSARIGPGRPHRNGAAARLARIVALAIRSKPGALALAEHRGVVPVGANDPLDDMPGDVTFDDAEVEAVLAAWDAAMPEYAGLLDAEIV